MDRDDAREMFDDLYGDYEGDWDDLATEPDYDYEDNNYDYEDNDYYDEEYYEEEESKNKFELFAKEQIDIKSRFKKFIIKEVNNESDILELLEMIKDQILMNG